MASIGSRSTELPQRGGGEFSRGHGRATPVVWIDSLESIQLFCEYSRTKVVS